ncbi:hypothetical protein P154DRAFT_413531, partial [Amniculicola lignicola CBS 123094]
HHHIQVVPRDDSEFDDEYDDGTVPVFRSPSLQYAPTDQPVGHTRPQQYTQEPPAGKTFADMARRFTRDPMVGEEKPTSGPISLAGLVKLQPNKKKGNRNWRPLQLSDFGTDPDSSTQRARLFGKTLPDPIRLHEEVGAFDGKVMYIGHPNRDISAHQWSDHSYQWVNIGLYSQNRHRIEGSLASDRIRGIAPVPNTLEYFKAVAEAREMLVKENGRLEHQGSTSKSVNDGMRSAFADGDMLPASTAQHLQPLHQMDSSSKTAILGDSARSPASSANRRIAIPDVRTLQAPNRPVYPLGLTIANPNRFVSTLNATAAPYNHRGSFVQTVDESGSEATTVNAPASLTTALRFSEPDGARQSATHTVVNGFNHQLPTPQNLRGPYRFFQDSVPTTLSPTTSLSVTVNDDEKLQNWFHDGQRPARIEDHWKSIMASENSSGQNVGVIGQGSVATENNSKYENTPIFMRLIETLQRYKDDSQAFSGGSDYFTRAFK